MISACLDDKRDKQSHRLTLNHTALNITLTSGQTFWTSISEQPTKTTEQKHISEIKKTHFTLETTQHHPYNRSLK